MPWNSGDTHLPDCAVGLVTPDRLLCATGWPHRWSGWPGAWCQDCGLPDAHEICIGRVCECPCHEAFWAEYATAEAADENMNSSSPEADTADFPQQAMEDFRRDNQ
jgi:hypothetical protein